MSARDEFAFANDVRAAREKDVPRAAASLVLILALLIVAFIVWAWLAVLDEVTRGAGKVVPAGQNQVVQSLEGGIVSEILVREGDRVEKDQVLVQLDRTSQGSRLGELTGQRNAKLARIARLTAQAEGASEPLFAPELQEAAAALVAAEQSAFASQRDALELQREVIEPQLAQRRSQIEELQARADRLEKSLVFLERELTLTRRLAKQGAVPELDLLRLERQAVAEQGELQETKAGLERLAEGVKEYENRLLSLDSEFRAQARIDLAAQVGELAVIEESISGAADRVNRTAIRAPVRGIVNRLEIKTIGGVAAPGAPILEIVPLDDRLVIEARIQPKDVAFVRPGQAAAAKLTAYDYTVYGSLEGRVTQVSPDTIADPQSGETFYRVVIETEEMTLGKSGEKLDILPGMVATVDILTGEKSVLAYLLKPVTRVAAEALRER